MKPKSLIVNETCWNKIRTQVLSSRSLPDWVVELYQRPFLELAKQAEIDCEIRPLDQSYLDFLQRQIDLNARGTEWTKILVDRRTKLKPWLDRELLSLSILHESQFLYVMCDPQSFSVVLCEAF